MEKGQFPAILQEWKKRDSSKGKILTWVTLHGKEVTGLSLGPDVDGLLCMRDQAVDIHRVISGDVNLVGKFSEKN